jgi:hypothetical protein
MLHHFFVEQDKEDVDPRTKTMNELTAWGLWPTEIEADEGAKGSRNLGCAVAVIGDPERHIISRMLTADMLSTFVCTADLEFRIQPFIAVLPKLLTELEGTRRLSTTISSLLKLF